MAESGWDWGDGDGSTDKLSGADGEDDKGCDVSDGEGAISLVRIISGLVEASRAVRYKYRHPRLSVVLTRIDEGANTDVDRLLEKLRNMGGHDVVINIHCLSPTLLIDTSVLIALASDIANSFVQIQPWHRGDIRAQIEEEVSGKSFIGLNVSPVLRSRALVCTWDAAQHFRQIVSLIGSKTEVLRASIILGIEDEEAKASGADLLHRLQRLSIHKLPLDLKLPIRVLDHIKLDVQEAVNNGRLPRAALAIDKDLFSLPANRSTFLYGWLSCSTVVTSNGALTTRLERLMEQKRETDDETGPSVFVFRFNRALTTKGRRSQGIVGADGD
ncbi:hypothetical protein NKR23_g7672 [Pleurostoma richardsiae]|uniref:Uncharacterized protein n=1 Tax=Pleurostoma richardsiae TaxID=41990 RepID=A0AA38VQM4_9PEZI|nr:hypothetical protein NKR23_g7672 [Pleurostoma richardsiae]